MSTAKSAWPELPYPTTEPIGEMELMELVMLWGRISLVDITVTFPAEEELLAGVDFPRLLSAMGRLLDEVGRLRGEVAALRLREGGAS